MKNNYVIGSPITHSLSPQIHNTAYQLLAISDEFNFAAREVRKEELEEFIDSRSFHALAVTIPHKQAVVELLDELDEASKNIGAVNTVLNREGELHGLNTDWLGALAALRSKTDISRKKVAVLGTGGSARAIVYGLKKKNIQTTVFGRSTEKTIALARDFDVLPADINAASEIASHDIIINATSVGLDEKTEIELIQRHLLTSNHVVFDIVYPRETLLLQNAKAAGAKVITGQEMLLQQAIPQIEFMTGELIDAETLRSELGWS